MFSSATPPSDRDNQDQEIPEPVSLADFQLAKQEVTRAAFERKMNNLFRAKQVRAAQKAEAAWDCAWQRLTPAIAAYLKGESSEAMVMGLVDLDVLTKTYSFDDSVLALAKWSAWPGYENERDQMMAAVCLLVIGAWEELKAGRVSAEELIVQLDEMTDRIPMEHVGYIREIFDARGLPDCAQCGKRLTPGEVARRRCGKCIDDKRKTLGWLGIAIECKRRYGAQVYGDDLAGHFPEWEDWKRRLQAYFGEERTDWQLWDDWIGFAQIAFGIGRVQFLATLRADAGKLLPPKQGDSALGGAQNRGVRKKTTNVAGGNSSLASTQATEMSSDDAIPKRKRAKSPSRVKAKAAYDYALVRIPNANHMTANELFDALKKDPEVAELLPPSADTLRTYLNNCGIRLRKGGPKEIGGSISRESDL